jgi:ABC-type molybdate transport system substrate-binding protein
LELTVAVLSILALILSIAAFGFSLFAFIETQAQKRSTHTVYPVANNEASLGGLEKQIQELTGQNKGDLERDLYNAGADPDELV